MSEQGWTITITAAGEAGDVDPDRLDRFLDRLTAVGGSVSMAQDASRYSATFSIYNSPDVEQAAQQGVDIFGFEGGAAGMPDLPIVHVEILSFAEHDAELARPVVPELVGVSEIADILAVSRQRAHQLTKRADFPGPVAKLQAGPVWTRPSLERFIEEWRSDTPDETVAMTAALDAWIDGLRAIRNQIAHGNKGFELDAATRAHLDEAVGRIQIDEKARAALATAMGVTSLSPEKLDKLAKLAGRGPDVSAFRARNG